MFFWTRQCEHMLISFDSSESILSFRHCNRSFKRAQGDDTTSFFQSWMECLYSMLKGLSLNRISRSQLIHRGVELADHFGYSAGGIQKGSHAARGMSIEARACGGEIYGLNDGGVTASLQSIAACGYVKPQARENLAKHMRRCGLMSERDYLISVGDEEAPLVVVDIPSYFSSPSPDVPMLVNAYRQGGYNHRKVDTMLAESRGWNELEDLPCDCSLDTDAHFVVHQMQRIENKEIFGRFKAYETFIADQYHPPRPQRGTAFNS